MHRRLPRQSKIATRFAWAAAVLAVAIMALIAPATAQEKPGKLNVVASFTILADLARQVGGERVSVTALVGEGSDAHVYSPKPADLALVGKSSLLITNGLGFEHWTARLVKSSGFKGAVVVASKDAKTLKTRRAIDPHAWQDPENIRIYIGNIRDALIKADPEGADYYRARTSSFDAEIQTVARETRAAWDAIPRAQRKIITSHDAFGYYGAAFGVTFLSPQGVSTESEPSAREVANLIRQIRAEKVKAVFIESISSRRLIDRIAEETGAKVGGSLYSDSLGGEATSWVKMMRHNTRLLTESLK